MNILRILADHREESGDEWMTADQIYEVAGGQAELADRLLDRLIGYGLVDYKVNDDFTLSFRLTDMGRRQHRTNEQKKRLSTSPPQPLEAG